ncbi:MAG: uroporphyrinogen-III synthase [Ignavibacteriales bacterium]|nr:MAG: uroporphyrinogen-III synthase [Ignavibacteriales bacterium]
MNLSGVNGKTIVVTRSVDDSVEEFSRLTELGAKLIHFPTLEYKPVDDWSSFDNVISGKEEIDFIVFTSGNSVKYFSKRCEEKNLNLNFEKTRIVAVGNKTARACAQINLPVSAVPEEYSVEGLSSYFEKMNVTGKSIFIPGSELSRKDLAENLRAKGNKVFAAPIYKVGLPKESIVEKNLAIIKNEKPDVFVFTSPSTFRNFLEILKITEPQKYFDDYVVAVIGSTTKKDVESCGVKVKVMPSVFTIEKLVDELIEYFNLNLKTGE